jgi:cyd operon protein YbgE
VTDLSQRITQWHAPADKALYRALSFALAVYHISLLMWSPEQYADDIGGFNPFVSVILIWGVCASMVFSVGFKPRYWLWQVVFSPYLSLLCLFGLLVMRIIV